jgi:hypothetical protein
MESRRCAVPHTPKPPMTTTVKDDARRLIDQMPEDATWEDLQYEIYFRQAVEKGLLDSREGRVTPLAEVRRKFGIDHPCP